MTLTVRGRVFSPSYTEADADVQIQSIAAEPARLPGVAPAHADRVPASIVVSAAAPWRFRGNVLRMAAARVRWGGDGQAVQFMTSR